MENVWKKAGALLGNLFTGTPDISEEEKAALKSALDEDVAVALATANARVTELERQQQTASEEKTALQAEKESLAGKVKELEDTNSSLSAKISEYDEIKGQMEAYQAQVKGAKPAESKTAEKTEAQESYEEKAEDLQRIKGELKYSSAGL